MDTTQHNEILLKLQELQFQIGRLVSDAESEKEFRKQRNADIESRLRALEQWKSDIHGRIVVSVTMFTLVWGAIVAVVVKLVIK